MDLGYVFFPKSDTGGGGGMFAFLFCLYFTQRKFTSLFFLLIVCQFII
jgi:hypothetical protein